MCSARHLGQFKRLLISTQDISVCLRPQRYGGCLLLARRVHVFIFIHQKTGSNKEQTSSIKTNARKIEHKNAERGAENTQSATN